MIQAETTLSKYELVVGLEVHVQLSTVSKIFSRDSASFTVAPNTHVSAQSLALPGTLPYINSRVLEFAIKMGLATHCTINQDNYFDRKHYFYADLPKGFQTTQNEQPICVNGFLDIKNHDGITRVRINRIHMEEDAGKSIHDQDSNDSLIDLNRAGVPLLEVVSEPDIRSAQQAANYLSSIRQIARYLDICDGNMEEGSVRCDANISVRLKGAPCYGNRCEVKNLNSIRNLQRAIEYEFRRQVGLIELGQPIVQNTLHFDATTGITSPMRNKEMANDYRYFPEPDLLPIHLSKQYIKQIALSMPELPEQISARYQQEFELSEYDALLLSSEKEISQYFDATAKLSNRFKAAANWINGPIRSWLNDNGCTIDKFPIPPSTLMELIELVDTAQLNHTLAVQKVFPQLLTNPEKSAKKIAEDLNLLIDTSTESLQAIIDAVLEEYADKVHVYKNGKKGLIGLFMGEIMKRSGGKIDPQLAQKMVIQKIEVM